MSLIKYNGAPLLSGQPDPYVTRTPEYIYRPDGRVLTLADKYSLIGQITGCQYSQITGAQAILNKNLSVDFKKFEFIDIGFTGVVSGVKILNIDYTQGINVGVQPYTVNFLAYPENFFESLGVVEKKNQWSVSLDDKNNLTFTHEMSAKGVNTSAGYNNALDNAKNFVLGLTGFNPPALFPFFISGFSGSLDSRNEIINRVEATYAITESYIGRTDSKISDDITINLVSGLDGIITVTVNGNYKLGKSEDFALLTQKYSGTDIFSLATGVYNDYRKVTGLFYLPLSSGVKEDTRENTLNFDVQFNDWPTVKYRHIPSVQITSGLDGIITASVNGEVQGLGRQNVRYDNAFNFFKTLDVAAEAIEAYSGYVPVAYPFHLNLFPTASGTNLDRFQGKITYNVTFSDKPLALDCPGIKQFDYSITKEYPIRVLKFGLVPYSVSGGCVQDLNYNTRATLATRGNVLVSQIVTGADVIARQFINNKYRLLYLQNRSNLLLDNASISLQPSQNTANFEYSVSFDETSPTNPSVDYVFITGLQL